MGGFHVISDSRKVKTVRWADQEATEEVAKKKKRSKKVDDEDVTCLEFRVSQFPKDRHSCMTKEELMHKWQLGPKTAEQTMLHTRQQGTHHATFPLSRMYPTGHNHNRFPRLRGHWYANVFTVDGETNCLIIYNGDFVFTRPMLSTKQELGNADRDFATWVGMPDHLTTNAANYFTVSKSEWKSFFKRNGGVIKLDYSAPYK
mmetsp:Transcript_12116/g.18275  ORF Transcript_12116/g.18275 Transcript_12116/m.18275 type:complete len:202 (-) Transcript_12116:1557-2162(-)